MDERHYIKQNIKESEAKKNILVRDKSNAEAFYTPKGNIIKKCKAKYYHDELKCNKIA